MKMFKSLRSILVISILLNKQELLNDEVLLKTLANKELISIRDKLYNLKRGSIRIRHIEDKKKYETLKNLIERSERVINIIEKRETVHSFITGQINTQVLVDEYAKTVKELVDIAEELLSYEAFIKTALKVQRNLKELRIFKDRKVCIAEGWIPEEYSKKFREVLRLKIPRIIHIGLRDIRKGEEAPTLIAHRKFVNRLSSLTLMRGIPEYWEVDPTPFFVSLFAIMYGLMFGDIGLGAILAIFGAWLLKTGTPFLGISKKGARDLGALALISGLSSTFFGVLYGVLFLKSMYEPIFLSPLHNVVEMMGVALLFGVIQLFLAMFINVINHLMVRDYFEAFTSSTGFLGIVYYLGGCYLAYNMVLSNYDLKVALSDELMPVTSLVLGAMLAIFLLSALKHGVMNGFIEVIEMVIAYPANSLSYIRVAAFAMVHEVFGELAINLSSTIGEIPSYLFANILVLVIEGFVVGIQALRLIFYEFSTKFFKGEGMKFEPLVSPEYLKLEKTLMH